MKPSFSKAGADYYPVIIHTSGKRERLYGDRLATVKTAKKYAMIEICRRNATN